MSIDANALAIENVELRQALISSREENEQHRDRLRRIGRAAWIGPSFEWDEVPTAVDCLAARAKALTSATEVATDVQALINERDELKGRLLNLGTVLGGYNFPIPENPKDTPEQRAVNIIRQAYWWLESHRDVERLGKVIQGLRPARGHGGDKYVDIAIEIIKSVTMGPADEHPTLRGADAVAFGILRTIWDEKAARTLLRALAAMRDL